MSECPVVDNTNNNDDDDVNIILGLHAKSDGGGSGSGNDEELAERGLVVLEKILHGARATKA